MHDDDLPETDAVGPGHNRPSTTVAQWQTPHRPESGTQPATGPAEPDLDLVEQSFVEAFTAASDPTSFLRLAGIPFTAVDATGKTLNLLRVSLDHTTDVGSVTPHLGGQTYRYDPLPAKLVSRRQTLRFIYHDGGRLRPLGFADVLALRPAPKPSP